jgi:hypothetical protein
VLARSNNKARKLTVVGTSTQPLCLEPGEIDPASTAPA